MSAEAPNRSPVKDRNCLGASPAGGGPVAGDEAADLRDRVQAEPIEASAEAVEDAFSALASLLLDLRAAKLTQGGLLTPARAASCPDRGQPGGTANPTPAQGEAA